MDKDTSIEVIKPKSKLKKYHKILILIIISVLIEIFICNFPAFRTIILGNNNIKINYNQSIDKIVISDIGVRTTSIKIVYEKELTDGVIYSLTYVAEEDNEEKTLKDKTMFTKNNHYINFDTHSKCEKIEIKLTTGSEKNIKEIIINHPNFNISLTRILIIFSIILFIRALNSEELYRKKYYSKSIKQQYHFLCLLMVICVLIGIYTIEQKGNTGFLIEPHEIVGNDAILLQAEAFMNKSISLGLEPSEELLKLEDPYDHTERLEKNADFHSDMTYYNGKYYSYFGITPVITLVLPFRMLTGKYLRTYMFNLVYVFGIIFLLYEVYRKLIEKYVKKISLCNFYLGYFAMLIGSNLLVSLRGAKYDIVTTSGIMFLLLSILLALKLENQNKYQKLKLIGLGISTGLIVLSKPTFIVYYPLILFLAWTSLPQKEIKEKIKDAIWAIVPLGILAIFQMIYNYLRFDNILEFGARYQLTTYNMQYCMTFTLGKAYIGIADYIFKLPSIDLGNFPFVFWDSRTGGLVMNEVCYRKGVMGLISIPILWIFLFQKNIFKNGEKHLKWFTRISTMTVLTAIIIITTTGGICEAYSTDFKVLIVINAVILLLKYVEIKKNNEEANKIFAILCIITIIIMLPISLTTPDQWLISKARPITVFLKNIFEFWI